MSTFVELASRSTLKHRPIHPKPQLIRGNRESEMTYWSAEADEAVRNGYPVNIDGARDTLLEVDSGSRGWLIRSYASETLAVNLMAKLGRADLRRCGSALLEWVGPDRQPSQTLLWAALDRSNGGEVGKLFAGDLLNQLDCADLINQAVVEKPDQMRAVVAKALGGAGLEAGLDTVADYNRCCGIIAACAALAPLSIAEQLAVHNSDRNSTHITLGARLAWLDNNKEEFGATDWLYELTSLSGHLETDQRAEVLGGVISTLKPYIMAAIDEGVGRGWNDGFFTTFAPNEEAKLDAALTLLGNTPTVERWGWVCRMWGQTHTAPSVAAAAATLHRHPELIGLVGAIDDKCADECGPALVAAANRAAQTVESYQQWGRGRNRGRDVSTPRTLLDNFALHPNLLMWLLAGNEALVCPWAMAKFSNNAPTVETATTLAATLESAYGGSILWESKKMIAPNIYRAILVNTPGVPDRVRRYGQTSGQTILLADTLDAFSNVFGENVDKWAALDALMNEDSFNPNASIAQTLDQLG